MTAKRRSLTELAAFLSDHCRRSGIEVVLSGGACVSIYSHNKYMSYDLDFVLLDYASRKKVKAAMEAIGFREEGRHFRRPDTPFIVEFLSPPLSVGEEPVREISEIRRGGHVLKLLSPTDCAKDRLAAFYHWNDKQSLEQAVLVARNANVDLREIQRWSRGAGMQDKLKEFKKALGEGRRIK